MKVVAKYPRAYQYRHFLATLHMPSDPEMLITQYEAWMVIHKGDI